jgi:Protein of unknown function (DUF3800)
MNAPLPRLGELGAALCWQPTDLIAMLWAYFDESGEYQSDGTLRRLTLGGCIASFDNWQAFNQKWRSELDDEGIQVFHMADFEAREGEFPRREWNEPRRRKLLGNLLSIINQHVSIFVGFANFPIKFPEKKPMRAGYDRLIARSMINATDRPWGIDEEVSIVFACHPEFSSVRVLEYFEIINPDKNSESCTVATPQTVLPLQAADLFAYELMKFSKPDRKNRDERYPFRRLRESAKHFTLHTQLNSRHPLWGDD